MYAGMGTKARGLVLLIAIGVAVFVSLLYVSRNPNYVEKSVQISQLVSAAIHLVEASGKRIVTIRRMNDGSIGATSKGFTKEGAIEYVTMGDKDSNNIITSGFLSVWPTLKLRSEENGDIAVQHTPTSYPLTFNAEVMNAVGRDERVFLKDVAVWVDPLDATQEYTEGGQNPLLLKYVTVMVCIAINGEPIAGIIHQPYGTNERGLTYWGWVGHGVSKTVLESVSHASPNAGQVNLAVSRSHPGEVLELANKSFAGWKAVNHISVAGAGYKALAVATGTADLYLHMTAIKKWDICAGDALLRTMGGKLTTLIGKSINYSFQADPKVHEGVLAVRSETSHKEYLDRLRDHFSIH